MAAEWTSEEMEKERPACFPFFLGECENGATCNYSHAAIYKANLSGIMPTASKETVQEALEPYSPVHFAFTGNPAHLSFGKGQGVVGFASEDDLVSAVRGTLKSSGIKVALTEHLCRGCGALMRFSQGGTPYFMTASVTGSKKDGISNIARQAAGPFSCGECGETSGKKGSKKAVASSTQPRALKQGEVVW
mmetsp:Transcript_33187/g.64798  ORF Transcript_33187/g.64798 Transcript_33187/m.64798 type:complete len:191 (-) Transcript_33187:75-647(-)